MVGGAEDRELRELGGLGLGVAARVAQDEWARRCRHHGDDHGALDAGDATEDEQATGEHRTAVARGDDGVALIVRDARDRDAHRRVGLGAERLTGVVMRRDHVGRVEDLDPIVRGAAFALELELDTDSVADEGDLERRVCADGAQGTDHFGVGSAIAPHRIDDDPHGLAGGWLLFGGGLRDDLLTAILAAAHAEAVRDTRRPAVRAGLNHHVVLARPPAPFGALLCSTSGTATSFLKCHDKSPGGLCASWRR